MTEGAFPSWKNGIPICPKCQSTRFNLHYREIIEYPVDTAIHISSRDSLEDFYNHKHLSTDNYLVALMCSYCFTDIVITDKIRAFFTPYEEYSS